MKIYVKSLNICPMRRVNIFQYREALKLSGHHIVDLPEEADKILVWTCAVRQDFHNNSIEVLKKFEQDGHQVVAAGCLPSIDPELVKREFRGEIMHYKYDDEEFRNIFGGALEDAPYPVAEAPITIPLDQYRAEHPGVKVAFDDQYIKLFISEGCTKKCSYCTEIQAFPPYQSYPLEKITLKAREMVERTGVKKIALFGDDIGAYGNDTGSTLIQLIEELVAIDSGVKISLKQIHPLWWKNYFKELKKHIDEKNIFQMLVPIQSANTRILNLMGRGYSAEDLNFLFDSVKDCPELELETHVIAGFPTETSAEWEETVQFVCKHRFRYVMGNIFMPGPGTLASEMTGQVNDKEKEARMLTGAEEMERQGTVVGHNLSWRAKEHITHTRVDFTEL
jgi:threonylcarbamoyladenosine tRNA methylthiotransferase CDKAL1